MLRAAQPWITYGDVSEGAAWMDRFFALDAGVPGGLRARALVARAELAFEQQDYDRAAAAARDGLDLALECNGPQAAAIRLLAVLALQQRRLDDAAAGARAALAAARAEDNPWEEGLAHIAVAAVLSREADLSGAQSAYEAALEVLRDNNGWGIALAHYGLGWLAMSRQDRAAAMRSFRTALGLYREIDARPEMAKCLAGIGWAAMTTGDLALARESLTESAQLSLATGQRLPVARGLTALGVLALAERDPERAIRLEGAAMALREELGKAPAGPASQRLDGFFADARQRAWGDLRVLDRLGHQQPRERLQRSRRLERRRCRRRGQRLGEHHERQRGRGIVRGDGGREERQERLVVESREGAAPRRRSLLLTRGRGRGLEPGSRSAIAARILDVPHHPGRGPGHGSPLRTRDSGAAAWVAGRSTPGSN
jgi:tetratricopeptide (TPR) repeat protein